MPNPGRFGAFRVIIHSILINMEAKVSIIMGSISDLPVMKKAAALPGVIAALTPLPVIGVPIKSTLEGRDALLSIVQMPPGIAVATVGIDAGMNAGVLATQIIALTDDGVAARYAEYRAGLSQKIVKINEELREVKFDYKTN